MDAFLLIPPQTKFGSILVYIGINLSIRSPSVWRKSSKYMFARYILMKNIRTPYFRLIAFDLKGFHERDPGSFVQVQGCCLKMHNSRLDHILLWKMRSQNLTQRLLDTMWPVNVLTLTFGQLYKVSVKMVHSLLLNTM